MTRWIEFKGSRKDLDEWLKAQPEPKSVIATEESPPGHWTVCIVHVLPPPKN